MFNTVFVIDDNPGNNLLSKIILTEYGFVQKIHAFLSAKEALEELKKMVNGEIIRKFPEIIFLDINMPRMNGWEFLEQFEQLPQTVIQDCQVYMLSSSLFELDEQKAKTYSSVRGFFEKPISEAMLKTIKDKGFLILK